ncbi:Endogenous retrovirus group K member 9 Pol protein, partial [Eudyptes filholi]
QGSLGFDLETAIEVTLTNAEVCKIPSNANGPLLSKGERIGGLLLGRSSAGIKGLLVIPGVIDADYEGKIYIMAYTISPPLFVPKGSRIAQILAFENPIARPPLGGMTRGSGSFGSTGPAVCFTTNLTQRPMECVTLQQEGLIIRVYAMLDTGADITIIN